MYKYIGCEAISTHISNKFCVGIVVVVQILQLQKWVYPSSFVFYSPSTRVFVKFNSLNARKKIMHAIRYRFISVRVNFFCRMTYFFRDSRGKGKKERKKAQAQEKKNG